MKRTILSILCVIALTAYAYAQAIPGELLIKLETNASLEAVVPQIARTTFTSIKQTRTLSESWQIYKVSLDAATCLGREDEILRLVNRMPSITVAQWDHNTEERSITPNDPFWIQQRDMNLIGLTRAWENTTGGLTQSGDSIVVAVLEKGMQKEHPDLVANLWRNYKEIPNNNKDDDNNGYIDDYTGWDAGAGKGSGNGNGSSHGTSVCGIVGARGNEEFGVTGVNWNVKVLPIVNVVLESEIIAAYNYVGDMRRRYNASKGKEGAFVVATNASFGIDNARAADYPLWCMVYDSLGVLGVLNVAATANANIDVDTYGDMPTTCNSEFLLTVTNIDAANGKKVSGAGFGATSIDIGSPGTGTFTAVNRIINQSDTTWHGPFGGTSASCPHTSGAVGLIYSVKCVGYVADALTSPATCVRRVRDAIFHNLREESTLAGITTQGGRLDVDLVIQDIMELCSGTTGDLEISEIRPNPVSTQLQIRYQTPDYEKKYAFRVFNMIGQQVYDEAFAPPAFEAKIKNLDVSNWPQGMYILVLEQGKKQITKKFIKI